jgi:hypothetical protein
MCSYLSSLLKENQFSNFASFYNDKVSPIYERDNIIGKSRIRVFSENSLSGIFLDMLIAIAVMLYSFTIPDFSTKLKAIMDNFYYSGHSESGHELNDFINDNSFVTGLRTLFVEEFKCNFSRLLDIIKSISFDRLSVQQRKRIAIQIFLKKLPARIKENHEKTRLWLSSVENIDEYFCSLLLYGTKKYRVFFALKGIRKDYDIGDDTKADLGDVIVYGNKWNFQESVKFRHSHSKEYEIMDKFKVMVFCDVKSNNPDDAFVEAKQRCFDALSRISYTYFASEKQQVPRFDPLHDITELPPIRGILKAKMPQPIGATEGG